MLLLECPACITCDLMFVKSLLCECEKDREKCSALCRPPRFPFKNGNCGLSVHQAALCLEAVHYETCCCSVPTTSLEKGLNERGFPFLPWQSVPACLWQGQQCDQVLHLTKYVYRQIADPVSLSKVLNALCDLLIFLSASRSVCLWELFWLW